MEDEFESSARLLPAAEAKQAEKPAVELVESKPAAESKEQHKVYQWLLPAAREEQVDSKPAAECPPAESQPAESQLAESEDEHKVREIFLLPASEEKPIENKPAVELAESKVASASQAEHALSELQPPPAAEELPIEQKPAAENKPAIANKPAVLSKPAESKPAASKAFERPFRVKLRGSVLVLVRLPNKRSVRAAIHQLSTSGGVIHFEKPLDEKLEVELIFHLQKATIRGKAQMLFPMWATQGWMQPFRFVNLAESSRGVLDEKLKSFLGEAKGAAAGA